MQVNEISLSLLTEIEQYLHRNRNQPRIQRQPPLIPETRTVSDAEEESKPWHKRQEAIALVEQIRNNTFPRTTLNLRVRLYLHLSLMVDIVFVRWPGASLALS